MPSDLTVAEFDDYPLMSVETINLLDEFKSSNSLFCATLFAAPYELRRNQEALALVRERPWLHLGVHGIRHRRGECRRLPRTKLLDSLKLAEDLGFSKIAKPPHYGYGRDYVELLSERGYVASCRDMRDILVCFDSPIFCPSLPIFSKYDKEDQVNYIFGHPDSSPFMFSERVLRKTRRVIRKSMRFCFSHELAEFPAKIYLGSGDDWKPGFMHFDKFVEGAIKWEWGQPLPYRDGGVSVVLIQQSLMYAPKTWYPGILRELKRVLCAGGVVIIKEDDDRRYVWRNVGTKGVKSTSNLPEMRGMLESLGLKVSPVAPKELCLKYPNLLNRIDKVSRGKIYVVEALKPSQKKRRLRLAQSVPRRIVIPEETSGILPQ